MLKKGVGQDAAITLLVVGGHSVAAALIDRQIRTAIYESLGVASCIVIFIVLQALVNLVQRKNGED